jgi:two-component system response regulator NreC
MSRLRILLADDHTLLRAGLRELLVSYDAFEVVGEASDGVEAVEAVRRIKPDLVILDIGMPKMRGIEAITEIKRDNPETKVLVLSMHDREEYVRQTLKNGADGYLLKKSAAKELVEALEHIASGSLYISPAISRQIVTTWLQQDDHSDLAAQYETRLTEREKAVMKLLAEGYTNKEVAAVLTISPKTVETHRAHIMTKLEIRTLPDLVRYAIKNGFVEL